ncbi:MAG: hypothetical protein A2Y23_08875 [Clostridiales bacterium GWB2_37_7]|nr:MAG: hypothetical protein A2Y23_08875 [Clostridiales bacterium GWB2_37_7]
MLYHAYLGSQTEIIFSLLGLITPFVILMPLYILNMLGAGDIKLLCSIGALIGMRNVLLSIAFSFLFGSVVALAIMLANKNFISRFKNLYIYLKSCLLNMSILPYYQLNMNNDGKMHFTIPIALGTIAVTLF